ncbi:alpha/beta hydrolase [Zavarzinia sp. CC-PAN008]|uniref:alpha/beta hydrolase n=1 Tax=Zavarzinia sp. CC-PAN008 TaxID=3243332 RepID=UPI003F7434C4
MPARDTRHLVDPELLDLLAVLPAFDATSPEKLGALRAQLVEMGRTQVELVDRSGVTIADHWAPGHAGGPDVRVMVFTPTEAEGPLPAYLHIHGGGYVMGSPELSFEQSVGFARDLGCIVASVDYRVAPEVPYPGPVEDCYAALLWLFRDSEALGVDPTRIAIGGESAGGGLAAALGLLARDRREVPVALQVLIYPMLDDRTVVRPPHPVVGQFVWTANANRFGWSALLGQDPGADGVSPYAAPARAEDLSGLPPTFMALGALDLFLDEDLDYAGRLLRAGVPTELHVYPGAFHAFNMAPQARVTQTYRRDYRDALRRGLGLR